MAMDFLELLLRHISIEVLLSHNRASYFNRTSYFNLLLLCKPLYALLKSKEDYYLECMVRTESIFEIKDDSAHYMEFIPYITRQIQEPVDVGQFIQTVMKRNCSQDWEFGSTYCRYYRRMTTKRFSSLHSTTRPSVQIISDASERHFQAEFSIWFYKGKIHRSDGPAVVLTIDEIPVIQAFFSHNKLHREKLPAVSETRYTLIRAEKEANPRQFWTTYDHHYYFEGKAAYGPNLID